MEEIGKNGERFTQEIYTMCKMHNMTHLDAITLFCEEHDMDVQDVIPLIGSTLKEQIRMEAEKRRMLEVEHNTPSLF